MTITVPGCIAVGDFLRDSGDRYDLAFVDPPYDLPLASVEEVLVDLMNRLDSAAIVVVHRRFGEPEPNVPAGLALVWERRYGDAQIWRYERSDASVLTPEAIGIQ